MTVVIGYLIDGLIGDPRWLPHPVRGIGWLIAAGERTLNRGSSATRLLAGAFLTVLVVAVTAGLAWGLQTTAALWHPLAGEAVAALGIGVLLARRSLAEEAGLAVYRPLLAGDLTDARRAVSWVVGRDTAALDASEVSRAAIETLAENASDGIVAPLCFALLFGFPGIAAYKAVNTLDSMIGHRDERYEYFGKAAARLDDLVNLLPARLTCLAMLGAAALQDRDARAGWRVARAEARQHQSPNAGWPETAMAGALGLRLGGLNYYQGEPSQGCVFNPEGRPASPADIPSAVSLMHGACHLVLLTGAALRFFLT